MIKARIPAQDKHNSNLKDYEATYKSFSWEVIASEAGLLTGPQNVYYHLVTRAIESGHKEKTALFIQFQEQIRSVTYEDIEKESSQWAKLYKECGLLPGERVFFLLPGCPELYMAILGAIKAGLVITPLYHNLTVNELEIRLLNGRPSCVVTNHEASLALAEADKEELKAIIYTDGPKRGIVKKELVFRETTFSGQVPVEDVTRDSPLYLMYTSGSVGPPKGVVHCHRDVVSYYPTGMFALDLRPTDRLWVDGPIAWVTGLVYGLLTPLFLRVSSVIQTREFDSALWYQTIERFKVTVWYTTPMTLRKLRDTGLDLPKRYDLSSLRLIFTVGEALTPDLFYWTKEAFGLYPHDNWWMTETGAITIANFPSLDLKPGSMGRAFPGIKAEVIDEKGDPLPAMSLGELAVRVPWPSMPLGIFRDQERFKEYFRFEGLFSTGDMVVMDEEGYFYHQGRVDDIIKLGDKMIGPFEVESALANHPAVSEVGVISKTVTGEGTFLKAFVALKPGNLPSLRLREELKAFAKANLNVDLPLKDVEFLERLPRTRAGKLLRRVLRAKELGIPISY